MFRQSILRLAYAYLTVKGVPTVKEARLPGRVGRFGRELRNPRWILWELSQLIGPFGLNASDAALQALQSVRCPALFYLGKEDNMFPPSKIIGALRRAGLYQTGRVDVYIESDFIHPDPQTEEKAKRVAQKIAQWLRERQVL